MTTPLKSPPSTTTMSWGYVDSNAVRSLSEKALIVCRIILGSQGGTGFLIGENLIMTNHHVIPDIETAKKAHAVFFYTQHHPNPVQLDFDPDNFFCTSPSPKPFKPTTKDLLDFTIVAIKPHPKITEISHLAFSIFATPQIQQEMHANMIHHPIEKDQSSYQKVSFRDNRVKEFTQFSLHYTTATMPGSSGAPVMDDDGNLFALHRATCTELWAALLKDNILMTLLNELFPGIKFEDKTFQENHPGKCALIQNSLLWVFTDGPLKGTYYHEGKTKEPTIVN